ncbi:peptidoglycan D,D-transpeptidase FtsI family protein [Desulforamulus ferrireducens]|uniref:Peptidoglycan glycosyltransferase n=1 Tax=Desulforamulus ferrireducens TaxID=1833852 RepID=A0A1S6J0G5_9FIRM|nr:penicillin-binding transpeptidase domain-containing protein [Desulforamulus ferrireducens]AQS60498.1 peptidoglycan glycosyltransferase [Desulforamulus ferrireducens]
MNYFQQKRLVKTFYLIAIFFATLLVHLAVIQLIHGADYNQRALEQRTLQVSLEEIPRGQILDRTGVQALTMGKREPRIILFPQIIQDKQTAANKLARILGRETEELLTFFNSRQQFLPYPLTESQVRQIKDLRIPGVLIEEIYLRYGSVPLAAHVIGHLGPISQGTNLEELNQLNGKKYKISDLVGSSGLEYFYEKELKAQQPTTFARAYVDVYRQLIRGLGITTEEQPDKGRQDLITTLDWQIQATVESIMDEKVQRGAVVVMDARTGDLLAMASRPNFHPGNIALSLDGGSDTFLDHCTALYQPGSIFKVVVAAAALEEGLVKATDSFVCLGEQEQYISCWHKPGHGPITFEEAFAQSCNPVFAELAIKLGPQKIIEYARAFGLESQHIIGYPLPRDKRQDLELIGQPYNLVNSSIGQGPVLATPVQLSAMLNVIVNNGVYIEPRLVKGLRNEQGKMTRLFPLGNSRKVIASETAKELKRLLLLVTEKGVGKEAMVAGYLSAGKTGSAEIGNGKETVNAWFSGFAPYDKPRYVVTVLVEEGISGGVTAAPIFREIVQSILLPH